ncbi:MAG: TonB-dependent receptor plug domain-containing protein [Polyangiaceae bacterium]
MRQPCFRKSSHLEPSQQRSRVPPSPIEANRYFSRILVSDSGGVEEAKVVSGTPPFSTAALEAAPRFRFTPARFRGKAVAAKIRFLVRFEPKEILSPPTPPPEAKGTPKSPAPGTTRNAATKTQGVEVVVVGIRPAYTTGVVTRAEAREVPGTFGDPLRAIESSPGVTPIYSGVPFFFVRGAPPGNIGIFLDGVKVPLLYHALLGPSVIHPALIDHVTIYRGAPTAQFGRYAGAVINAETRPPISRLGGEGNIRIFDAGALIETPFAGGNGHALVGGRYSYTALAASLLTNTNLAYWDYQSRLDYAVGRNGRLGVFAFGSYDRYSAMEGADEQWGGTQFHRIDTRYDVSTSRTQSRIAVTVGRDKTDSSSGALSSRLLGFRSMTQHRLGRSVSVDFGSDLNIEDYRLSVDETTAEADDLKALFPARTDITGGAFTQLNWQATPWASIAPGIRADGYRINDRTEWSVDPRLSATFKPHPRLFTAYTVGVMHQAPNFVPQVPAAYVGTLEGGLQRAVAASTTIGTQLPYDLTLQVSGFHSAIFNLLDPIGRDNDLTLDPNSLRHRERGSAVGLEFELRAPMTRRIGGFVACTWSHSDRSSGNRESLSAYDRPIVLQGALGFDLGRNYRAGARLAYYSGVPALELNESRERYFSGTRRSDPYFRADLRLEKRWPIRGRGYWAFVAEMLNATMSREITSRKCSVSFCKDEVSGPVAIPSIGVEMYSY